VRVPEGGIVAMTEDEILITTSEGIPGRNVVKALGLVRGHSVRARGGVRDIQAGVRTMFGGRVGVYAELLEQSREEALNEMVEAARKLGANAVVATRLATSQVMGGAAEVVAYGTAAVIE
jgi:uncharacterized protein YbjQ (UPF0145 family)